MRLKTIGNAFLIFACLLASAGIFAPQSATSAAVAVFALLGFTIVTVQSHRDWSAGYRAAQLDMSFSKQIDREKRWDEERFKCSLDGCFCEFDDTYRTVPE